MVSIQPVNEPAGFIADSARFMEVVKQYYEDSYQAIRQSNHNAMRSSTQVLLSDAFQGPEYWGEFMPRPKYTNVGIDTHCKALKSLNNMLLC